jgi:hypothetical protein
MNKLQTILIPESLSLEEEVKKYDERQLRNQQIYQAGDKTKEYYEIICKYPGIMEKQGI